MKVFKLAVVCCLILMFIVFPFKTKSAESAAKCAVPPIKAAYADSKAVFAGKVTSVTKNGDVKTFVFEVERYWKGVSGKQIEISVQETMRYQAWFEAGESYLVYARGDAENKTLWERRCSRTKRLSEASEDISRLGRAREPVE